MLARNVLSAEALGLTDVQLDALVAVLGMLERGELRWISSVANPAEARGDFFNMGTVMAKWECGSVGCIVGWADAISSGAFAGFLSHLDRRHRNPPLFDLFTGGRYDLRYISAAQAAAALRNYLANGRADWDDAMKAAA
jgi:hypothetical protein